MATEMEQNGLQKPHFEELGAELRTFFYGPGDHFMEYVQKAEAEEEKIKILKPLSKRQEQAVEYVKQHGSIPNKIYRELFDVSSRSAGRDLQNLTNKGVLQQNGTGRGSF